MSSIPEECLTHALKADLFIKLLQILLLYLQLITDLRKQQEFILNIISERGRPIIH